MAVLQMNPLMDEVEKSLLDRFTVYRFWETGGRDSLTPEMRGDIRAIVAGGDVGADADLMGRLPNLEIVAINGVGVDRVDLDAARKRGIRVTVTPRVLTDDVADLAVGLAICLCRRICSADAYLRGGEWSAGAFALARRFSGRRSGIVGLGEIGGALAARLAAFGHEIGYVDPVRRRVRHARYGSLEALAADNDFLFVSASADASTRGMVDAGFWRRSVRRAFW